MAKCKLVMSRDQLDLRQCMDESDRRGVHLVECPQQDGIGPRGENYSVVVEDVNGREIYRAWHLFESSAWDKRDTLIQMGYIARVMGAPCRGVACG